MIGHAHTTEFSGNHDSVVISAGQPTSPRLVVLPTENRNLAVLRKESSVIVVGGKNATRA